MKITILDPAMCCSTGVCGENVDDQLVATAANVKWLKSLGYDVQRHNISNDAEAFKTYPVAIAKLQKEGTNSLPYILISNELAMSGKYPDRKEWEALLLAGEDPAVNASEAINKKEEVSSTPVCCTGSGCC